MKTVCFALLATCVLALVPFPATCQEIIGTVVDDSGHAVQGIKVSAQAQGSTAAQSAITNSQGQYKLDAPAPGVYSITLDPALTNLKGQSVESHVDARGLTVNWAASPNREPIAWAQPGTSPTTTSSVSRQLNASTVSNADRDNDNEGGDNDNQGSDHDKRKKKKKKSDKD